MDPRKALNKAKKTRKWSSIWKSFEEVGDGTKAKCSFCGRSFCYNSSQGSSNLSKHLKTCLKNHSQSWNEAKTMVWELLNQTLTSLVPQNGHLRLINAASTWADQDETLSADQKAALEDLPDRVFFFSSSLAEAREQVEDLWGQFRDKVVEVLERQKENALLGDISYVQ